MTTDAGACREGRDGRAARSAAAAGRASGVRGHRSANERRTSQQRGRERTRGGDKCVPPRHGDWRPQAQWRTRAPKLPAGCCPLPAQMKPTRFTTVAATSRAAAAATAAHVAASCPLATVAGCPPPTVAVAPRAELAMEACCPPQPWLENTCRRRLGRPPKRRCPPGPGANASGWDSVWMTESCWDGIGGGGTVTVRGSWTAGDGDGPGAGCPAHGPPGGDSQYTTIWLPAGSCAVDRLAAFTTLEARAALAAALATVTDAMT